MKNRVTQANFEQIGLFVYFYYNNNNKPTQIGYKKKAHYNK
jgi:hypothetical protein